VPVARRALRAGSRRSPEVPAGQPGDRCPRPHRRRFPGGAQAKLELARELVADLERIDAQRREAKRRTARAVAATRTSINDVYGVGPIVAGTVLGYVRDIRRFPTRDRFASYNGTAPIEVSSGDRKIYRLSRRGNRQLNHAIHMAAISQIRHLTAKAAPTTRRRSPKG
jgi:transposase